MTDLPNFEPEPMAAGLIIGCLLSAALIVGTVSWFHLGPGAVDQFEDEQRTQVRSGILFPPLAIDTDRLEKARDDHYTEPDLSSIEEEIGTLRSAFRKANLGQFPNHGPEGLAEQLGLQMTYFADEVILSTDVRGFQSVGEPIFQRCRRGLDDLLHAVRSGDIPMSQALEDPPARRFYQYRENCGNLLPVLTERGLISEHGDWKHDQGTILVQIMQRYRWADLIRDSFPVNYQISPYELELFFRWRIEDNEAFTPPERRRYLSQARPHLPDDYDFPLTEARLEIANSDMEAAVARFAQLSKAHPDNELYRAIHDEIERQLLRSGR